MRLTPAAPGYPSAARAHYHKSSARHPLRPRLGPVEHDLGIGQDKLCRLAFVIEACEQIADQLEPRCFFHVGAHDTPRGILVMALLEHTITRLGVVVPMLRRYGIDRRGLSLL